MTDILRYELSVLCALCLATVLLLSGCVDEKGETGTFKCEKYSSDWKNVEAKAR